MEQLAVACTLPEPDVRGLYSMNRILARYLDSHPSGSSVRFTPRTPEEQEAWRAKRAAAAKAGQKKTPSYFNNYRRRASQRATR